MERTAVNPWKWSLDFGFNQAEIIEGPRRQLICSGQTSVDADGQPQHPGDDAHGACGEVLRHAGFCADGALNR